MRYYVLLEKIRIFVSTVSYIVAYINNDLYQNLDASEEF